MKYKNCMYGWNYKADILVAEHPDKRNWSSLFDYTAGSCWLASKKWPKEKQQLQIFIDFCHMVVRDGINPKEAHQEFLKIDEYRECMAEDMPPLTP